MVFNPLSPIGIFDSGIGGLTVLKELKQNNPKESFIYYGDTARVPYGSKSSEIVIRYAKEISEFLHQQSIKLLVVACNTVSSCALDLLRQHFSFPIIGVIEPGVKRALEMTRSQRILVLGTKATIKSGLYEKKIKMRLPAAEVFQVACPLFVPLVEEQFTSHPAAKLIVFEYLKQVQNKKIDTVILGCTHYPFLSHLIQNIMGDGVQLVDSASACAEAVKSYLIQNNLAASFRSKLKDRYFVSDDQEGFERVARLFLEDLFQPTEIVTV